MTRKPDAIAALRGYARDLEQSLDARAVARVDVTDQRESLAGRQELRGLRLASLAAVAAVMVGLVVAAEALPGTEATDSAQPAPIEAESTVRIAGQEPAVNAVRAVAMLRSVGLTSAADTVEHASRTGVIGTPQAASLLSDLMEAVDAWILDPVGDLTTDPAVIEAIDGLAVIARPPGLDPEFVPPGAGGTPPGQDENFVPPGQDDDFVPPGQDDDFVSPGQDDDFVPPGQDDDFVPPGQDDDFVPPGQDEDFVPPGQDDDFVPPGQDEDFVPPGSEDSAPEAGP